MLLAERDGYKTRNIDNYAGDFEFGQGDEVLGIFAHLDVVPAVADGTLDPYGTSNQRRKALCPWFSSG